MQLAERRRHWVAMRSKDIDARPMVLRELSLLRALGTSLRTPRLRPAKANRASLLLSRQREPPDAFALLPPAMTPLDQVSKLK
ncbi:MAG TPA: hypothetical protein VF915_24735 [Reyranella sp.]